MGHDALYHMDLNYLKNPKLFGRMKLYQIGRMFCKPTTVIDTHVHVDWFELTIIISGSGKITTNGIETPVGRGDIHLSFPCDAHKIESDRADPLKFDFFSFSVSDRQLAAELASLVQVHYPAQKRTFRDERIQSLIQNAITEFNEERFGQHAVLSGIFGQAIVYLIRDFQGAAPAEKFSTVKDSEALCYRIMNYVDTHIYSLKNLSEVAEAMGYSAGYISTLFKKTTSHTLLQYYNERKFETARLLVVERRLKISEIAELLNYSSVYAFSKAFDNWFGVSPRDYANEYERQKRAREAALEAEESEDEDK